MLSLERMPPAPTLVDASRPLERFLNIEPNRHIVSMSLRDPLDIREMPSNGNKFISAHCIRGVRKVRSNLTYAFSVYLIVQRSLQIIIDHMLRNAIQTLSSPYQTRPSRLHPSHNAELPVVSRGLRVGCRLFLHQPHNRMNLPI